VEAHSLQDLFQTPLSFEKFCELDIIMQSLALSGENDKWEYIWGSREYSSAKAYKHLMGSSLTHPTFCGFGNPNVKLSTRYSFGYF
jgi:hypothetical protein